MLKLSIVDLILGYLAATLFFCGLGVGVRQLADGKPQFFLPKASTVHLSSAIALAPLFLANLKPDAFKLPFWDILCIVAVSFIIGPLTFPTIKTELYGKTTSTIETLTKLLLTKLDHAVKIAFLGFLVWAVSFVTPKFSLAEHIPILHLLVPTGQSLQWKFADTFSIVAIVSVLMATGKLLGFGLSIPLVFLPCAAFMASYAFELTNDLSHQGLFTTTLAITVLVDFARHSGNT